MAISQGGQGGGSLFTEINITPLTDIFLVLLIIMMVIAPMFQNSNKEISVPAIQSGQSVEDNQAMVEITKAGKYFINGSAVSEASLAGELKTLASTTKQEMLSVRADKDTDSSVVLKVFESASLSGFKKLTIAGEPLSQARQKELSASSQTQQQEVVR